MNELQVTLGDRSYHFSSGDVVRIGRSPDNDIVISDPTVSRQHAQLSHASGGWEFKNVGRALSFLNGQQVSQAVLSGPAEIQLSSPNGPVLAIQPGGVPTQAAPDHTSVLDGAGLGHAGGEAWETPAETPWQ
jgi:pSer/pThr/pTyr-binding forkhead associated (FHA) protein